MEHRGRALDIPAKADARTHARRDAVWRNVNNDRLKQRRQQLAPMAQDGAKVT